jgi:DNA-binding transcriptional LysR family regulator
LGYTQAAISQQVAALEADLRVQLLTRRPVAPTEAGARLLEHAEPLLLRLDAARADVARITQAPAAALSVGATPIAAATVGLARALAGLRSHMPRLRVTVHCGDSAAIGVAVARGENDLGLVHGLAAPGDALALPGPLNGIGVAEGMIAAVLPNGHPLAGQPGVRLSALADARWIDAPGTAPPLADIRRVTRTDGFRPAIRYDGTDTGTLVALAAAGHGLALLPGSATTAAAPGLTYVPVTDPPVVHRVELIHGAIRAGSPAAALSALLQPASTARGTPGDD